MSNITHIRTNVLSHEGDRRQAAPPAHGRTFITHTHTNDIIYPADERAVPVCKTPLLSSNQKSFYNLLVLNGLCGKSKNYTPLHECFPPYSISSQNAGKWITNLVSDYKRNLNEKNIQPLSDDYIKFIRLGQYYVDKNGEGVLAYISNNGFLDGIIHRQMRKSLLESFDKIYILNLHGNSRRKETSPDGGPDENVFDIMQGVSINIFVKTDTVSKKQLAKVYYKDLYGIREDKYNFLASESLSGLEWTELTLKEPQYFFVPKDHSVSDEYNKGFSIETLFNVNTSGIVTGNDKKYVSHQKFPSIENHKYCYRPFDSIWIDYKVSEINRPRVNVMRHMMHENYALILMRKQQNTTDFKAVFLSDSLTDKNYFGFQSYVFPLYVYNDTEERYSNISEQILNQASTSVPGITPESLFDYVYAFLFCEKFRKKFQEMLVSDFPRIPYPKNAEQFYRLAEKGAELRKLHLIENVGSWKTRISFPASGTNAIDEISFNDGNVHINNSQYFGNVSELAWNFHIGGYQPAQKWLKDRKGRTLDYEDILHYGHIVYALEETDRIMKEIDTIVDL